MDAARLRELLGAGDAEQRASALAELEQSRVDTALAVECLPALAELLRKPVAEVDAQETQRIGLVLGNLCGMAAATLGAWLNEGYYAAFSSPGSALDQFLSKPVEELTRDDVLTAAALEGCWLSHVRVAEGDDQIMEAMGTSWGEFATRWATEHPLVSAAHGSESDARHIKAVDLSIELLDPTVELPPLLRLGVWQLLLALGNARPAVQRHAVEAGIMSVCMAEVRPEELCKSAAQSAAVWATTVVSAYGAPDDVKTLAAATPGLFQLLVGVLRAYEAMDSPASAMVSGLYYATLLLVSLLSHFPPSDAATETLRGEAMAIRYILDHPQVWTSEAKLSTSTSVVSRCLRHHLLVCLRYRPPPEHALPPLRLFWCARAHAGAYRCEDLWSLRGQRARVYPAGNQRCARLALGAVRRS
jgi:hypothetical protein